MTLWIRIDSNIGDNPNVLKLAELRGVSAEEIVGVCVILFGKLAEHCPDGDVSKVSDAMLERWASWKREPGTFASDFRTLFVTDGVVEGWAKRQGKLLERAEKEKERWHRRNAAKAPKGQRGDSAEESAARNVTVRKEELPAVAAEPKPAIQKAPRPKRAPLSFMGRLNSTWKRHFGGDMPKGSATILEPVVADVGEEETDSRLEAYCDRTEPEFASVRAFAAKHGAYGDVLAVDPATGTLNAAGLRAMGGRR